MRSSLSMQRHAPCTVSASSSAWRPSPAIIRRPKATSMTTTLRNSPSTTSSFSPSTSQPSQRLRVFSSSSSSSSSSGSIWDSEVVQKEFEVMMRDFADVSNCWLKLRERERQSSDFRGAPSDREEKTQPRPCPPSKNINADDEAPARVPGL